MKFSLVNNPECYQTAGLWILQEVCQKYTLCHPALSHADALFHLANRNALRFSFPLELERGVNALPVFLRYLSPSRSFEQHGEGGGEMSLPAGQILKIHYNP